MRVQLSRETVLQSALVPPNWYPCEVASVKHEQDKDGADYDRIFFKVIDGEFKGKELSLMSSEKFTSAEILQAYEALLNIKIDKDNVTLADGKKVKVEDFPEVDHDTLVGKKCMVKTKRGEYNGKPQDNIESFRPLKAVAA